MLTIYLREQLAILDSELQYTGYLFPVFADFGALLITPNNNEYYPFCITHRASTAGVRRFKTYEDANAAARLWAAYAYIWDFVNIKDADMHAIQKALRSTRFWKLSI